MRNAHEASASTVPVHQVCGRGGRLFNAGARCAARFLHAKLSRSRPRQTYQLIFPPQRLDQAASRPRTQLGRYVEFCAIVFFKLVPKKVFTRVRPGSHAANLRR